MAFLYISELSENGFKQLNGLPVAAEPGLFRQKLAIGVETKSNAFSAQTRVIRVHCDAICSILGGKSPTATTDDTRLPADHTEYFMVQPGHVLSVIANT